MKIIKLLFFILVTLISCNSVFAQSLGKMKLGCKRSEVTFSLPKGYNICKTNTNNQLTYTTSQGNEYVSFYFDNNIVYKIIMHKYIGGGRDTNEIKSKLEELIMSLYETWGEPTYIGENVYWQYPTAKITFSYNISTLYTPSLSPYEPDITTYFCYADIKLEKRHNLFE